MALKMVSLKKTPEEIAAEKKRNKGGCCDAAMPDPYPWNTQLNFDTRLTKKIPSLMEAQVGDGFTIVARASVTRVESVQKQVKGSDEKKTHEVNLQIESVDIRAQEDFDTAFKEAVKQQGAHKRV